MVNDLHFRNGCRIIAPSRTSISVIDMNMFAPGKAGAGNIGFAIDYFSEIDIKLSNKDEIIFTSQISSERRKQISIYTKYILEAWRKENHIFSKQGFLINFDKLTTPHIGVASFASIHFCILYGINWIMGCDKNELSIRKYLYNHYKEVVNYKLSNGFTTGLSSLLSLYGGFAIINEYLEPKCLLKVPDWKVYLVKNSFIESKSFGINEVKTLMGDGRKFDKSALKKKNVVITNLIKSVKRNDLTAIGNYIREIQSIGSKVAEIGMYGNKISNSINSLFDAGLECCFLSAVGPGIVIITEKEKNIQKILNKNYLSVIHKGFIDNKGIRILTY